MRNLIVTYLTELIKKILPYLRIMLVLFLVISNFKSLVQQIPGVDIKNDPEFFSKWENRFDPVKETLPFKSGVIGYAADWDVPDGDYHTPSSMNEHVLTQLAMSPIVVSRDLDFEWILVYKDIDDFNTWIKLLSGEYKVIKYKYNLYLVHRIK